MYHMKARAISQWPGTCTFLKNGPQNRPVHVGDMCFLFQWVGPFSWYKSYLERAGWLLPSFGAMDISQFP